MSPRPQELNPVKLPAFLARPKPSPDENHAIQILGGANPDRRENQTLLNAREGAFVIRIVGGKLDGFFIGGKSVLAVVFLLVDDAHFEIGVGFLWIHECGIAKFGEGLIELSFLLKNFPANI